MLIEVLERLSHKRKGDVGLDITAILKEAASEIRRFRAACDPQAAM